MIRKESLATSPTFYTKLVNVAKDVGMRPEDILLVMARESGINPTAHNADGNASGLIQFMPDTLRNVGFQGTHNDFRKLSAEDQLDYVHRYIKAQTKNNGKPFDSAAQYYVANFVPAALKLPGIQNGDPKTILASQNPTQPHLPGVGLQEERAIYNANKGLDMDKDGAITYGDLQHAMADTSKGKTYQSAVAQMEKSTGYIASNQKIQQSSPKSLDDLLNQYLSALSTTQSHYLKKKAIKQLLPNNYLLKINTKNHMDAMHFAQVLCKSIDQHLYDDATIHTNGHRVEVQATIHGSLFLCTEALSQLSNTIISTFDKQTTIKVAIHPNTKSKYQELSLTAIINNHDLFRTS